MRLKGRTAIVTGGARNIGREYCIELAKDGANVVVADIRDPTETVELLKSQGADALGIVVDVSDESSVADMVKATLSSFGQVDVLVNNAALYGDLESGPLETLTVENWDRTMAVNLRGVFLCLRAVIEPMRARRAGSIINISSATIFGAAGGANYVASKAGVIGLSRTAARELGPHNIRVNAVTPGFTMSQASLDKLAQAGTNALRDKIAESTALRRSAMPADLVGTINFLASDDSAFITGQIINVDGGWAMH